MMCYPFEHRYDEPGEATNVVRIVKELKDLPALLLWYLNDERPVSICRGTCMAAWRRRVDSRRKCDTCSAGGLDFARLYRFRRHGKSLRNASRAQRCADVRLFPKTAGMRVCSHGGKTDPLIKPDSKDYGKLCR